MQYIPIVPRSDLSRSALAITDGNHLVARTLATSPWSHPGVDVAPDAASEPLATAMPHLSHS